jgi:predicted ribosome quality control (RQC) complex YloA/Tae2 family protein
MPVDPTPKDRFTSLDALALVRELRTLGPARVEKAFDVAEGGWSLSVHPPGGAKRELLLLPGRYAALLPGLREHTEELSPVARELRRLLAGAVIRSVADPGAERYLEIALSRSDEPDGLRLAVEFFGLGNLVVARGPTIAAVTRPRTWAHRTVRIGSEYARPPARADPWTMGIAAIEAELLRSRNDLASTLAARLSLGGPVAEELIVRGGFHGAEAANGVPEAAGTLRKLMDELLREIGDRPRGYLYRRGPTLVDATPYRSRRWGEPVEVEERPTFSEAAAAFFPTAIAAVPTEEETARQKERAELERQSDRQRQAIAELAEAAERRRADADAVLSNFPVAEAALEAARVAATSPPAVDVELDGRTVSLPLASTPRQSAQLMYAEAKRLVEKLEGARAALLETADRRAHARPPPTRARPVPAGPPKKPFWFERYRWFISSEGAVAIAGRDARSNDLIVKRNLKDGDIYVHADLHGAASVVVKRSADGVPIGEASLTEACQWAVSYSKAWRAGYATGTAFWATPEQVSKTAASGEFVARGAWVIHGTKHFVRDMPLELALGTIRYLDQERWTVAPEASVRARGVVRCLVTPGEERERSTREEALARELGIDRSLLQSLLPAGGLAVRRP